VIYQEILLWVGVKKVKFIGVREETTNFLGTMDLGVLQPDDNYKCRFNNITFQGLVTVAGGQKGHIFKECSFEGGFYTIRRSNSN